MDSASGKKKLFVHAWFLLGWMRFRILTRPFKKLVSGLRVHQDFGDQEGVPDASMAMAREVGWAVQTASRFTPWQSACLVQVLAAQRLLQKRGVGGSFYLGAVRETEPSEEAGMSAHAWLKCGNEFITGEAGHERFVSLTAFSW